MHEQVEKPKENKSKFVAQKNSVKKGFVGSPKQLVTYAMRCNEDTKESFSEVLQDAKTISDKYPGGSPLISNLADWKTVSARDKKIVHIVAHGNVERIGNFDKNTFLQHLESVGINLKECEKIVLHTCDSGVPDERGGSKGPETILVNQIVKELAKTNLTTEVVGMTGHVVLDSAGKSRVLMDSQKEDEYKKERDKALKSGGDVTSVEDKYLHTEENSQLIGKHQATDAYHDLSTPMSQKHFIDKGLESGSYPPSKK